METLGSRVKKLREGLGLSQSELAKAAKITQASLSRIEAGKMLQLKSHKLKQLAGALRVTIDFLLSDDNLQKVEDIISRDTDACALVSEYSQMDAEQRRQLREFAEFLNQK